MTSGELEKPLSPRMRLVSVEVSGRIDDYLEP
jgi:hypothetical protein